MRDLTVLKQIAAHLHGWAGLHAWMVDEEVDFPAVFVTPDTHTLGKTGDALWRCLPGRGWEGLIYDYGGYNVSPVVATVRLETIDIYAGASEVADAIKAVYRHLRTTKEVE